MHLDDRISVTHPFSTPQKTGLQIDVFDWKKEAHSFVDCRIREKYLRELLFSKRGKKYDVLIPVRGDAEDYFVLEYVLSLGLTPFVLVVNNYFFNEIGWHNLHNLITEFDVDSFTFNPNFSTYRDFVVHSISKNLDLYYPHRALRTSFSMKTAEEMKIPWVIWGMCQPAEFTGKFPKFSELRMSSWWFEVHELDGIPIREMLGSGAKFTPQDIENYKYPKLKKSNRPVGLFLSNYLLWDQRQQNMSSLSYGFLPQINDTSIDWMENAGSSVYYSFKEVLRFEKYQNFKVWDHISRDLKNGYIADKKAQEIYKDSFTWKRKIDDFFLKFLDTTTSGLTWFKEKKLKVYYQHCETGTPAINVTELQEHSVVNTAQESSESYLFFHKGI